MDTTKGTNALFSDVRPLIVEVVEAEEACKEWRDSGRWESVPHEVIDRAHEADRALVHWVREHGWGWLDELRSVLIASDAEISHTLHRGSLASDNIEVGGLIARIRSLTG